MAHTVWSDYNESFEITLVIHIVSAVFVFTGIFVFVNRNNVALLANSFLAVSAAIVGLLLCEGALRVIGYEQDELKIYRTDTWDAQSFQLKANIDLSAKFGSTEISIKTNAQGYRWNEFPSPVRENLPRVAFVGDSFTFGLWASDVRQSFVGVFDSQMAPHGYQIMNFGVPGYGTYDQRVLIENDVVRYNPDVIVLMFYNGNDFLDTYLGPGRYQVSPGGLLTLSRHVVARKIPAEYRQTEDQGGLTLLHNVYLYRLVRDVVKAALPTLSEGIQNKTRTNRLVASESFYGSNVIWSAAKYPAFAESAKNETLKELGRIKALSDQAEARLMIVSIPSIEQVEEPEIFGTNLDSQYPQRHLQDFALRHGIPYLDLLPGLKEYAKKKGVSLYHRADGHFNDHGHLATGRSVTNFFRLQMQSRWRLSN